MTEILCVGCGGFIGAVARYFAQIWISSLSSQVSLPLGTLAVNVVGSFLMGVFLASIGIQGYVDLRVRLFLITGILGGFTTFSSFSGETLSLYLSGSTGFALLNVALQLICGLGAVAAGFALSRTLIG